MLQEKDILAFSIPYICSAVFTEYSTKQSKVVDNSNFVVEYLEAEVTPI